MASSLISNATKFRRAIVGLRLILAHIFLLVSDVLHMGNPSINIRELLDTIAFWPGSVELKVIGGKAESSKPQSAEVSSEA